MIEADWTGRVIAATALMTGAGALALEISRAIIRPPEKTLPSVVETVEAMQTAQYENALMDCYNEDILKSALGFQMGSFAECEAERKLAAEKAADKPNTMFPEMTPTPKYHTSGG